MHLSVELSNQYIHTSFVILCIALFSKVSVSQPIKEVKIGNQVWMAENLNVTYFRNGDPIPRAETSSDFEQATKNKTPAWCYYKNDSINGLKYGKLYNWWAVTDPRGLAPEGWHVPDSKAWYALVNHLGGRKKSTEKLLLVNAWKDTVNNKKVIADNSSGFSALPGGFRTDFVKDFINMGYAGGWWSSTRKNSNYSLAFLLFASMNKNYIHNSCSCNYLSVRCIKDN